MKTNLLKSIIIFHIFIIYFGAPLDMNTNESKVYYMITMKEINNFFNNLTPDNLGSKDLTTKDGLDLLNDTGNISDLY